jgi:hypothetical protein
VAGLRRRRADHAVRELLGGRGQGAGVGGRGGAAQGRRGSGGRGGGGLSGQRGEQAGPPACGSAGTDGQAPPAAEFGQGPRVPGQFAILRRRGERGEQRGRRRQPGTRFVRDQVPGEQRV